MISHIRIKFISVLGLLVTLSAAAPSQAQSLGAESLVAMRPRKLGSVDQGKASSTANRAVQVAETNKSELGKKSSSSVTSSAGPNRPERTTSFYLDPEDDPQFRSAWGVRLAGILVTAISGTASLVLGMFSLAIASDNCSDCGPAALGYGILAGLAAAPILLVGIPLWIAGQSDMNRIRRTKGYAFLPQVNLALRPNSSGFTSRWKF